MKKNMCQNGGNRKEKIKNKKPKMKKKSKK